MALQDDLERCELVRHTVKIKVHERILCETKKSLLKESIVTARAEKFLQHKVVRILSLIKQHWRCESNRTDEECQPKKRKRT